MPSACAKRHSACASQPESRPFLCLQILLKTLLVTALARTGSVNTYHIIAFRKEVQIALILLKRAQTVIDPCENVREIFTTLDRDSWCYLISSPSRSMLDEISSCVRWQLVRQAAQYFATDRRKASLGRAKLMNRSNIPVTGSAAPSMSWSGSSIPQPMLTRHPIGRPGQILCVSFRAFLVGLFQPVPPSPYLTCRIVMGEKKVGAAEAALAASQIFAMKANS